MSVQGFFDRLLHTPPRVWLLLTLVFSGLNVLKQMLTDLKYGSPIEIIAFGFLFCLICIGARKGGYNWYHIGELVLVAGIIECILQNSGGHSLFKSSKLFGLLGAASNQTFGVAVVVAVEITVVDHLMCNLYGRY